MIFQIKKKKKRISSLLSNWEHTCYYITQWNCLILNKIFVAICEKYFDKDQLCKKDGLNQSKLYYKCQMGFLYKKTKN